jgi:hypothetical protein
MARKFGADPVAADATRVLRRQAWSIQHRSD